MASGLQAWIYTGNSDYDGVDVTSVVNLKSAFETKYEDISVLQLGAESLRQLIDLHENAPVSTLQKIVIVFPGGTPSTWDVQLSDTVDKVREFVHKGARALMICAGAYFAAEGSSYKVRDGVMIEKQRSLKFFPGKAFGPIFSGPMSVAVEYELARNTNLYSFGGGYFVPKSGAEEGRDYNVLARYTEGDKEIAVASSKVGNGVAVLSFPHFEFDAFPIGESDDSDVSIMTMKEINASLSETVAEKAALASAIFQELCL